MKIDCAGCESRCCKDPKTPVLLPSEEEKLKKFSTIVKTKFRDMYLLGKKEDGSCIFLDDKTMKCTNYDNRPFECQLYPFLLYISETVEAVLDINFCPNTSSLKFDEKELTDFIRKHDFPKDWLKGYNSLEEG